MTAIRSCTGGLALGVGSGASGNLTHRAETVSSKARRGVWAHPGRAGRRAAAPAAGGVPRTILARGVARGPPERRARLPTGSRGVYPPFPSNHRSETRVPKFIVHGGNRIKGTIRPNGNKNAALPMLAATLLTEEDVFLENVPRIRDVLTLMNLLEVLGAETEWTGPNEVRVRASSVGNTQLDAAAAARIRASILLAGPMLARAGGMQLPPPGGDVIGRRRVDTHFLALKKLGARVVEEAGVWALQADGRLRGGNMFLDEPSVTATENAVMAASLADGETVIRNAAAEPHVQDLCHMLVAMGCEIEGIGTGTLRVQGRERLSGCRARITSDHIEVGSFIGLAAVTRGELTIEDAAVHHLDSTLIGFGRLGLKVEVRGDDLYIPGGQEMEVTLDMGGHISKVDDGPWPAFPADLTSIALVTATQCRGNILIHEKMFESRMFFADKLVGMGARLVLCDPHRVLVIGPSQLHGAIVESPDIRAGMGLLIAALGADGRSEIFNVGQIERGYERIDERLQALGADIRRADSRADAAEVDDAARQMFIRAAK
ncbi:MAG: UDP-N-acetylglucosamine 1-carboxyvinyltransferase [Gemmatimonadetes bacterium]|nr:UDP-N-acetylglucosamine 1-carboxyvinyltransferase [Gemmatimonadota bacterium]